MRRELSVKRFMASISFVTRSILELCGGRSHQPALAAPEPAPPLPRRGTRMYNLQK